MLQRIVLPTLCLIVGAVSGFWFGHTPNPPPASVLLVAPGSSSPTSRAETETARKESPRPEDARKQTRDAALNDLADDYSPKRAKKLIDGFSVSDITASLAYLLGKPKDPAVTSLRTALLRAWAKLDPQSAWKAALAMTANSERTACLGAVAGELAKTNPNAAMKLAMGLDAPSLRRTVLNTLFSEWGKDNASAAVAYRNTHPEIPVDSLSMSTVIGAAAAKDPATAARLALSMTSTELGDPVRSALDKWIEIDPAAARRWLDTLKDPTERDRAINAFVSAKSMADPKAAFELAGQIASSELRREALKNIMGNWMGNDPAAAIQYFASLDPNGVDQGVSWSVGYAMRNLSEQEQGRLLAKLPEGKLKTGIISDIVRSYTSNGRYTQGVSALNLMPDSPSRDTALHSLAASWAQADPKTLLGWINQQADSSDRDLVMAGYSATLAATDAQAAVQLAGTIPDKSVQRTALQNIATRWIKADPSAAKAWLEATPLLTKFEKDMVIRMGGTSYSLLLPPTVKQKR